MRAIHGGKGFVLAIALGAAGACGQPASVVPGSGGIETRPEGAATGSDVASAADAGTRSDVAPEAVSDLGAPWFKGDARTPVGDVVAAWTEDAWHHGVSLPQASASLGRAEAGVEKRFEANLGALLAGLPLRPRADAYVVDPETDTYKSADHEWMTPAQPVDPGQLAEALGLASRGDAAGLKALLDGRAPQLAGYRALVAASRTYQALCRAGGWAPMGPFSGTAPDDAYREQLAKRLALEGFTEPPPVDPDAPPPKPAKPPKRRKSAAAADAAPPAPPAVPDLEGIVTGYREARQLATRNRFVDEELLATLDVPCEARLTTIHLNVRRWRHTRHTEVGPRVHVNLAAQELLFGVDGDERVRSRTVVGLNKSFVHKKTQRRVFPNATPILDDTIKKLIVNPEWNVPPRIARGEIDVEVAKDPEYLTKNRFRVITTGGGGRMYVQESGDHNALGRLKLVFPNEEGVYMHDTPSKPKFRLPVRSASHGCVRVEKVFELGAAILDQDRYDPKGKPFDAARLRGFKGYQRPYPMTLNTPVPVVFEYYTASVVRLGVRDIVRFHPDIYAYDEGAAEALAAAGGVVDAPATSGLAAPSAPAPAEGPEDTGP